MNAALHWLSALRVYLGLTAGLHLIWEVAQLPLYTIWNTGSPQEVAFAAIDFATFGGMTGVGRLEVALGILEQRAGTVVKM